MTSIRSLVERADPSTREAFALQLAKESGGKKTIAELAGGLDIAPSVIAN